ncbi:Zinc finger RING-type [Penicillium taxi]|uniref:Zinc finger RING-type n=1 Tax=Penicillium taxi TaxID=168475 RepID=UPI00254556A6|nr:Zinc finger RING-type [Penicillium taxi]KAJ5885246.1 Zinc finger RING-type [Penicillium taxi]
MARDLQQVLQKTLNEVVNEDAEGNPCVICLESITEPTVAKPCNHTNFDYLCLINWLEQRPHCPLCNAQIKSVQYDLKTPSPKTYNVPITEPVKGQGQRSSFPHPRARTSRPRPVPRQTPLPSDSLSVRRNVYANQLYSLRVGTNRLSQYNEVLPEYFNRDEALVSRARKWIRRELQVFSFLNPEPERDETSLNNVPRPGQQRLENRRANNAEFLLEYIIAILRTVDIKDSAGQAEELLKDFLGRENARLFLHELLAWLRSPYTSLENWDRHVQYRNTSRSSSIRGMRRSSQNYEQPRRSASPQNYNHSLSEPPIELSASDVRRDFSMPGSDSGGNRGSRRDNGQSHHRRVSLKGGNDRSLFERVSRPDQSTLHSRRDARSNQ